MAGEGEGKALFALGGGAATPHQANRGPPQMDEEKPSKRCPLFKRTNSVAQRGFLAFAFYEAC